MMLAALSGIAASAADPARLQIYFIDVEGGQSTLIVTPGRETLLIDAGFAGEGGFTSVPGDPSKARDPGRIVAAMRDAGVDRIDYPMVTHFHRDHIGGVPEIARRRGNRCREQANPTRRPSASRTWTRRRRTG